MINKIIRDVSSEGITNLPEGVKAEIRPRMNDPTRLVNFDEGEDTFRTDTSMRNRTDSKAELTVKSVLDK
jgi:hypothetical protein